jgi:hypothetical protein
MDADRQQETQQTSPDTSGGRHEERVENARAGGWAAVRNTFHDIACDNIFDAIAKPMVSSFIIIFFAAVIIVLF